MAKAVPGFSSIFVALVIQTTAICQSGNSSSNAQLLPSGASLKQGLTLAPTKRGNQFTVSSFSQETDNTKPIIYTASTGGISGYVAVPATDADNSSTINPARVDNELGSASTELAMEHSEPAFLELDPPTSATNDSISTFYVDNVNGSDSNDGSSPAAAFATIAKVNSLMLTGGQTVSFMAGEEWHEQLNVSTSGAFGLPITYTSYGTGTKPIISASDNTSGWTRGGGVAAQEGCTTSAFCSGFESSSFADWTSSSNNNDTTVKISSAQAHHGLYSMALSSANGQDTRGWITRSVRALGANDTLAVRWYFLAPRGSLLANGTIRPLSIMSGGTEIGFATLATDASGNPSTIDFYDTAHSIRILDATPLAGFIRGGWNEIEIDISVSPTAGGGTLYLNGRKLSQISNIDNHVESNIDAVRLGNTAYGSALSPGGTVYVDDFQTANSANIGPYNTGVSTSVWYHSQNTDPRLPNFNGQAGTPVYSVDALTSPNQFYWDGSSKLYVYSQSDPTSVVELPERSYALLSPGASYIRVVGLELRGAQQYDFFCHSICSNWTVANNTITASYSTALFFEVNSHTSVAGISILNNVVQGGGAGGIQVNNGLGQVNIVGNEVTDFAKIYNPAYGTQNAYADGIELYSEDGLQGVAYVGYNYIHDGGIGNVTSYGGGIHADTVAGMDIEYNIVKNVNSSGIQLEKSSGSVARYNLIVNGGMFPYASGLYIRAGEGVSVTNQLAEYNTVYGGWWACALGITQDGPFVTATNIVIRKNICTGQNSGTALYTEQGSGGAGNAFIENSFGSPAPYFIVFNGKELTSYADFDAAVGYHTGSLQGTPQFVNPQHGDFTLRPGSPVTGVGAYPNQ